MKLLLSLFLSFLSVVSFAQTDAQLFRILKAKDSMLFEVGFNQCRTTVIDNLVSEHFEFYHDEHGITPNKLVFITSIRDGICKLPYKARRELVENTLEVYPLKKNGVLYGAIQTGVHRFYALEKGKPEYLTSTAKFTQVWLLESGNWKLSRSLSYDHKKP
jgi:hypothetical protein